MGQDGLGEGFHRENCDISARISTSSTRQQALWCPPRSLLLRARTTWWPPHDLLLHAQALLPSAQSSWGAPHLMLLAAQSLLLLEQSQLPAAQSHLLPRPLLLLTDPPERLARNSPRLRAAKNCSKTPSTRRYRAGAGAVACRRTRGWPRCDRFRSAGRCHNGHRPLP